MIFNIVIVLALVARTKIFTFSRLSDIRRFPRRDRNREQLGEDRAATSCCSLFVEVFKEVLQSEIFFAIQKR